MFRWGSELPWQMPSLFGKRTKRWLYILGTDSIHNTNHCVSKLDLYSTSEEYRMLQLFWVNNEEKNTVN